MVNIADIYHILIRVDPWLFQPSRFRYGLHSRRSEQFFLRVLIISFFLVNDEAKS